MFVMKKQVTNSGALCCMLMFNDKIQVFECKLQRYKNVILCMSYTRQLNWPLGIKTCPTVPSTDFVC